MAFYDWNHDGKKDVTDDFLEYQIYNESTSNTNYSGNGGRGISNFGAGVATVGGLFLGAGVLALFGGGEDTPVILTIIMWIICSSVLAVWFDNKNF